MEKWVCFIFRENKIEKKYRSEVEICIISDTKKALYCKLTETDLTLSKKNLVMNFFWKMKS